MESLIQSELSSPLKFQEFLSDPALFLRSRGIDVTDDLSCRIKAAIASCASYEEAKYKGWGRFGQESLSNAGVSGG